MITDYDLHLLGEGRHWQSYQKLGAHLDTVDGGAGATFAVWAPNATAVAVVGDFNDWRNTLHAAAMAGAGFRQVTSPVSLFRSFPAWLPLGSLDKAFVRGGLVVRQARIVRTSLARVASDHLPLVIDFHLGSG